MMRGIVLGMTVIMLSGCALLKPKVEPGGIRDWVELPVGTVITGVPLPTDEAGKKYNIIISKPSAAVSLEMLDRMGK